MTHWSGGRALEVLTLALDGEVFAVEAEIVREILDQVPITEVPSARPFVGGLINVRGKVVPLVDLRVKFGMPRRAATIDTRIVVIEVELDGEPTIVGMLADKVYEVTEITAESQAETPRIGMRWRSDFIRCIGKRSSDFIIVLDIDRVISANETAYVGPTSRDAAE
ncbi:MAG TPA: chemotaxis protein CheW [Magnetospirillum sp.]|nr:chemotaxis protein CheW [Magnetospirillum sp.]